MKRILLMMLIAVPLMAQTNKIIRQNDLNDYYDSTYGGGANLEPELVVTPAQSKIVMDVDSVRVNGNLRILGNILSYGRGNLYNNTSLGQNNLSGNNSGSGGNVAVGYISLPANTTGRYNVAVGYYTLVNNTIGGFNTAIGQGVLQAATTVTGNTGVGAAALYNTITGAGNTAVGSHALHYALGGYNTGLGLQAIYELRAGNYNVGIGFGAGSKADEPPLVANNSIYIGALTLSSNDTVTNEIVVGYGATGKGSNTTRLGNDQTAATYLEGVVTFNDLYTFPAADGLPGTLMKTDGNGNLYWASDLVGGGGGDGSDTALVVLHLGRYVPTDSLVTYEEGESRYQPLTSILTDIGDGTINTNLVNSANPWLDNELANNITVDEPGIASTITRDTEVTKTLLATNNSVSDQTITNGDDARLTTEDDVYDFVIGQAYITDGNTGWDNSYGYITSTGVTKTNLGANGSISDGTLTNGDDNLLPTEDDVVDYVTGLGYITDGNTNWNNSYGYITSPDVMDRIDTTTRIGVDQLTEVAAWEPAMSDSSIILLLGGVWQIFDLGTALQSVSVTGDTLSYTAAQVDSILTNAKMKWDSTASTGYVTQSDLSVGLAGRVADGETNSITEPMLYADNSPTDEYLLSYESTTGHFEWKSVTGGTSDWDNFLGAYFDTTATFGSFTDVTDATTNTRYTSNTLAVTANDVVSVDVDSGQYKVYYNPQGTGSTWSGWTGTKGYYRDVDSVAIRHYTGATVETAYTQTLYISNDSDVFTLTTAAGGGFSPWDLNPILYAVHDDSVIASGSKTVVSLTDNGFTFAEADTISYKIVQTDSSLFYSYAAGTRILQWDDTGVNPFDIGLGDVSFESWVYYTGNGKSGTIVNKGVSGTLYVFQTALSDGVITPRVLIRNAAQDTLSRISLNTQIDSLGTGWKHIVITVDRNVGYKMYIDSVLQTNTELVGTALTNFQYLNITNAEPVKLGEEGLGHWAVTRMYPSVLTPANVKALFEYGRE